MRHKIENVLTVIGVFLIVFGGTYLPFPETKIVSKSSAVCKFILQIWVAHYVAIILITLGLLSFLFIRGVQYIRSVSSFTWKYFVSFILFLFGVLLLYPTFSIPVIGFDVKRLVIALTCTGAYLVWRAANVDSLMFEQVESAKNYDRRIIKPEHDKLNRVVVAGRIFKIIENTSVDSTIRVGVFGKWGEGKSSLMSLVEHECLKAEYVTVWFNPWFYQNKKEMWQGFRKNLENSLIINSRGVLRPDLLDRIKSLITRLFNENIPKLSVGKLIDNLISTPNAGERDNIKEKIEEFLLQYLPKNGKVIVFIDDLDRVDDSKVVLELLKGIKEIVNIKGMIFVIAIDEGVVSEIIEKDLPVGSGNKYLEKIIDYSMYLTPPQEENIIGLIQHELEELDGGIKSEVIYDLKEYLPKNPRTIKRFLRYLSVLGSTLNRFSHQELNWHFLYLAQLLNLEFPSVFRNIMNQGDLNKAFDKSDIYTSSESDRKGRIEELINKKLESFFQDLLKMKDSDKDRVKKS